MPSEPPIPSAPSSGSDQSWLSLALVGSALTYLAHPPVGWSLLAWIGPAAWFAAACPPRLPGRHPYRTLWLAGTVFWLLAIQWIRLPHWANIFGLFFIAAYLGAYLPACVALTRVAVN